MAVDTSSWIAYVSGEKAADTDALDRALAQSQILIPPVVLTELLSHPKLPEALSTVLENIPLIEITFGYWKRSGALRAQLLAKGYRAKTADALIAQACIDSDIPLITRDRDFRPFASLCGLKLI